VARRRRRGTRTTNLTILNGTQGVNEIVTGLVGQGRVRAKLPPSALLVMQ
jgi:hypothetical protein